MSNLESHYDLFLSYNWRDNFFVEKAARALKDRGIRVFLDRWYLAPGEPWPTALERILTMCRAVVVFCGPNGLGSWQLREQYLALDRQTREPGFPVIPAILPGADPPLGFLRLNSWVDLRDGLTDTALDVLVASVWGEALSQDRQETICHGPIGVLADSRKQRG